MSSSLLKWPRDRLGEVQLSNQPSACNCWCTLRHRDQMPDLSIWMGLHSSLNLIWSCVVLSNLPSEEPVLESISSRFLTTWILGIGTATHKDINYNVFLTWLIVHDLLASLNGSFNICVVASHTVHESMTSNLCVWEHARHRCRSKNYLVILVKRNIVFSN